MSNYKMGVEKENRLHSVLKEMDFRKEYLGKLRIWNLTPIKLYVPTYPWGAFMHQWYSYLSLKTTILEYHNPEL